MHFEGILHNDAKRLELTQASRKAAETWRFRHLQSRKRKVLVAVPTMVLDLLTR
jgi:hypothetical protein